MRVSIAALMLYLTTLGGAAGAVPAFSVVEETTATGVTSIALAPNGDRLYAVTILGEIIRWTVDPESGALSDERRVAPAYFQSEAGPRGLIGMAFDPEDPQTLWVTDNHPIPLTGKHPDIPDFSGRISRLTLGAGDALSVTATPYVAGLPRSCADHVTNSLAFRRNPDEGGPAWLLYVTQGSNSAMGEIDGNWCMRPERLLGGAVLEIDPRRDPPEGGFDVTTEPLPADGENRRIGYTRVLRSYIFPEHWGALKQDPIAIGAGPFENQFLYFDAAGVASVLASDDADGAVVRRFYDPFAPDAVVRLYATGVRNAYDLVWHSNGWLYVAVNGASGGASTPDDPRTPLNEALSRVSRQEDLLQRLRRSDYGGHPNPLRDEYVAYGGNPTPEPDLHEIAAYPVGVQPDPRYRHEQVHPLGHHWSPTGTIEYRGNPAHPELDGALIFTSYSKGDNLRMIALDAQGGVAGDTTLRDVAGQDITSIDPIDVALGAGGRLYVATLPRSNGEGVILRLEPAIARVEAEHDRTLTLDVLDAANRDAVMFALHGLPADVRSVSLAFLCCDTRIPVSLDASNRFVAGMPRAVGPLDVTVSVERSDGTRRDISTQIFPES